MPGIGTSPPRPDGAAKVSGQAVFADDFELPGMFWGATLRSEHPHARLLGLEWHPEAAPPGSVCVTAADLPGPNGVLLIDDAWPILAAEETRHVGEPVALVAAPTPEAARAARAAVRAAWEPLEPILDPERSSEVLCELAFGCGDVEAGLAAAEAIVEGHYRTGHQEHIYIECQAMTAWWDADGALTVVGSMQCPYYVHRSLAHAFGLPDGAVRVLVPAVGGGFGGKEDFPSLLAIHAALLARAAVRPVRLAYDRHEDIVGTTKRHPALVRHRSGVDREGRLTAMEIEVEMDGGAYSTLSSVVLSRALLHATGPYRCANVSVRGLVRRTHTPPNGAFRGFGAPQVQFAAERQMDRLARRLGLDPLEIRLRNVLEPGDRLPTGQVLDASTSGRLCLETVAGATDFRRRWRQLEAERARRRDGEELAGLGLSLYFHGAGFTGNGERKMRSPVVVSLAEDGRIEVATAMTDMGQGCQTIFPQIACEAAGLPTEAFRFLAVDTARVPDSGPTVASRTTMVVGAAIAEAVRELRDQVVAWWREREGVEGPVTVDGGELRHAGGSLPFREAARRCREAAGPREVTVRHRPPAWQVFDEATYRGAAYPTYAWGADVAEVRVDPDTLEVTPVKVTVACEVGRAIHPTLCAGQIEGGTLQAVGFALLEEVKLEDGRYLNDRLATYVIPTVKDTPEIEVHLLERPWEGGPFGAKGVGELPIDGGAPAVAAAVENATGIVPSELPATPERLLAWGEAGRVVDPWGESES